MASEHKKQTNRIKRLVLRELVANEPYALSLEMIHDLVAVEMPGGRLDLSVLRAAITENIAADFLRLDYNDEFERDEWAATKAGIAEQRKRGA